MLAVATVAVWSGGDAPLAPAADGRLLFQAKGCSGCHVGPGLDGVAAIGPDLSRLPEVAATRLAGMSAADYVRESITRPQAFVVPRYEGAEQMPALPLDEAEVELLVDFLLSS